MKELIIYYSARLFGLVIQSLPLPLALWTGKFLGMMVYYVDARHKALAYANLKMAFSRLRSSDELKRITKILFQNYGRNLIESGLRGVGHSFQRIGDAGLCEKFKEQ